MMSYFLWTVPPFLSITGLRTNQSTVKYFQKWSTTAHRKDPLITTPDVAKHTDVKKLPQFIVPVCLFQPRTSIISLLVRLSCGSLYSVYLRSTRSMSVLAYWKSLLDPLKMISAISQSQRTLSSYAFFISPNFRLVNVTCIQLYDSSLPKASIFTRHSCTGRHCWGAY